MEVTIREALRQAIDEEMSRDENVFLMGEEVAQYNGAYKVSQGLLDKYGPMRVLDSPITEEGFAGLGIGAAMTGLRPIIEFMTFNFSLQAIDQIINNAAKMRYMTGGQFKVPIVFRGANGPAEFLGSQHSQACQTFFAHVPGLKVVVPSNPYNAKGLLKTAIRDDNPVIFMESELAYGWTGDIPEGEYTIPIGQANIEREGKDISIISYGKVMRTAQMAVAELEKQGVDAELIDLQSVRPFDEAALIQSVKKTNRAVIVDESWPMVSVASHLGWFLSHECFDYLDAPVELVTSEDVPYPYNHTLELSAQPSVAKIVDAAKKVLYL